MKFENGILVECSIPFITHLIPKENVTSRPQDKMEPTSITIHNTGNPDADAEDNSIYVDSASGYVSWHFTVGKNVVYQELPINEIAWHAGDGTDGNGNRTSIAIEISEEDGAYETALLFIPKLLKYLGWQVETRVVPHKFWSGKDCPRLILSIWNSDFIPKLKSNLDKETSEHIDISDWAKIPREFVMEFEVSDGTRPKDNMTREEKWTMLYDYHKNVIEPNINELKLEINRILMKYEKKGELND